VRDFANREETLNREDRNLTEAAELRFQQQMRVAENDLAQKVENARGETQVSLDHIQGRFAARERRLHDAHASGAQTARWKWSITRKVAGKYSGAEGHTRYGSPARGTCSR
jgi:hypothetical protein